MVNRIVGFIILPCMVLALLLSFAGVHQVTFDYSYYQFMTNVSYSLGKWKLAIPNIPQIPLIQTKTLLDILNVLVYYLNAWSTVINVLINLVNFLVQIIQFVMTLVYCVGEFIANQVQASLNS